jgi:hypothetical protein
LDQQLLKFSSAMVWLDVSPSRIDTQGDAAQYDHEAASGATVTEEKILAMKRLDATVASYSLVRLLSTRA